MFLYITKITMILFFYFLSPNIFAEPSEIKIITKDGVQITKNKKINVNKNGTGIVYTETQIDILESDAAARITQEYSQKDAIKGSLLCATMGLIVPAQPAIGFISSLVCAHITTSERPYLLKNDRIITEVFAGAAGGVGGSSRKRELALTKRRGKTEVLWFIFHSSDTDAEEWMIKHKNKF